MKLLVLFFIHAGQEEGNEGHGVCFGACGSSEVFCLVYLLVSLTGIWGNGGCYLYACFVMDGHERHYRAFLI